jgi:hypothetical protein
MLWAIELEVGFAEWRELVQARDDPAERLRWVKMCHRLGSKMALGVAAEQIKRAHVGDFAPVGSTVGGKGVLGV